MAKNFYSKEEACEKLELTPTQLRELVEKGDLRELRDAGKAIYKAKDIDRLADGSDAAAGDDSFGGATSLADSFGDLDLLSTAELTLEDSTTEHTDGGDLGLRFADDEGGDSQKTADTPPASDDGPSGGSDSISFASDSEAGDLGDDASGTGSLVLTPLDESKDDASASGTALGGESGINLDSGSGFDLGLESGTRDAVDLDDTTTTGEEDDKEGTVVSSIGVSVFDDDDIEQAADPLAQTVVADEGEALGIDGVGSGSGLLDLTRESDDTSLGAELLDEIYPGDESGAGDDMGDDTRAGLEDDIPAAAGTAPGLVGTDVAPAVAAVAAPTVTQTRVEFAPDALGAGLTGMLFVAVLIMLLAGFTTAAAIQGVWPDLLETAYQNNWIVGVAGLGLALVALGVGYFLGKRSA